MVPPPRFSFSAVALAQLGRIRQQYLELGPSDPPAMLGVFWGWPIGNTGQQAGPGAPSLGYWRKSELTADSPREVVQVDGVDLIFGVMPAYRDHFEGKVLDYSSDRAFFLRLP